MSSNSEVQEVLENYVLVKLDPRDKKVDASLFEKYMQTNLVPEITLVNSNGDIVDRLPGSKLGDMTLAQLAEQLKATAKKQS